MNQVLLGMSVPFVIGLLIYTARKFRLSLSMLILLPVTMLISGLWAIAPDIPRVLGMSELYTRLASDPRTNIFYWHYTIDMIEHDSRIYLVGVVFLMLALLFVAIRELEILEKD